MKYKKLVSQLESLKQNNQADAETLDEAMDIIVDYEKATEQLSMMMKKYEAAKDVNDRGAGMYQCPDCFGTVYHGNEHCRRCGRRLGWPLKEKRQEEKKQRRKQRSNRY